MIDEVISHYRIIKKLGAGGMGEVYLANDLTLGRQVALKLLPQEHTQDPERLRRFKQEARSASALNHPNILTIHEVGEADGRHFIATEFIDGETLRASLIRTGSMGTAEALHVATQTASALAAAHEAGIVHRDIKPENIMLRRDGYVKVLDFGLAKLTQTIAPPGVVSSGPDASDAARTQSGMVLGTTQYMSPEQAAAGSVDARSDIFSFGAVLYEMVTGVRAFQGSSPMETVAAILTREPAPLSAKIPTEFAKVILRCLRKDPARRYQTMADLKVALEDLEEESGAVAPGRRAWLRHPLMLLALLPALLAGGFLGWRAWRGAKASEPLNAAPLTALPGIVRYPSFSPDGDRVAFTWSGAERDNPDIYVQQIGAASPVRLTSDPGNDFSPVWSPDGRWIAFLRSRSEASTSEVRLIPSLGGPERKLTEILLRAGTAVTPPHVAWCPDNTCLLVTDSPGPEKPDALFVISLETGEKRQLTKPAAPASGDTHPSVSPDGHWLVFRRMATLFAGELYRLRLGSGMTGEGEPTRLTPAVLDAQHPAWMPDSKEVLFSARGTLWRIPVAGGTPTRIPYVGEYGLMPAVSHPTRPGSAPSLVYIRSFEDANIWRIDTSAPGAPASKPPTVSIASTRLESMPQFSPDGRRVAFTSDRSGTWEIWVSDPDGANSVQMTSMGAVAAGYPHWSPDGKQIAFHSNVDGQWEVYVLPASGGKPRNVTNHPAVDDFPSFSRDGRWIYFSSSRSGDPGQTIWKVPVSGGGAVQLTKTAGLAPQESADGAYVYFVETLDKPSLLRRLPVAGGPLTTVLDGVYLANFAVLGGGIYYIDRPAGEHGIHHVDLPKGETRLRYFDFTTRRSTTVAQNLGAVDLALTVAPDGRTILFPRLDSSVNDLMLVKGFR
jgi:Tol biopolymer transport system component